ncbi:MAG: ImmA/IrrE family metallo-endopeptidase [Candidatus Aenigmatarchaeota archaeon]
MFSNLLSSLYEREINAEDLERAKQLVSKFYQIPKDVLDKVKIKTSYLPTIYAFFIRKIGNYLQIIYKPLVKILGFYNPERKEIYIDRNLSYSQKIKTILHEYVHAAQDYLGKLYTKTIEELEEEAHNVSDYLSKIYNQVSRKFLSFLDYPALV